jgi:flagellar basal-body rod protein FlgB
VRIFDSTLSTLERALDARLLRHNVLAGNLANADTPGYTPRDIDFAAAMREATSSPNGALSAPSAPAPIPVPSRGMDLVSAGLPMDGASDIPLTAAGPTAPASPGTLGSPVVEVQGAGAGLDGNAVDSDRALAAVAENALQYNAAARAAGKKLAILRYAASDGTA